MKISYLREFVAIAKNASFTKTAAQLNTSQPVLSRHITAVEKAVGCELIERSVNPIVLTPHGEVFLEHAMRVLVEYDAAMRKMKALGSMKPLALNVVTHVGCKHTDDLIRQTRKILRQTHPLMVVNVRNADTISPVADVMEKTADVALICDKGLPIEGVDSFELFDEPLCAVVKRGHRLSGNSTIAPSELSGEIIWCSFAAPVARHYMAIQDMLAAQGADAFFQENTFHGTPDTQDISFDTGVYVEGAGIVAHSIPLTTLTSEYVAIPLEGGMSLTNRILKRKGDDNPASQIFIDAIVDLAQRSDMSMYWRDLA